MKCPSFGVCTRFHRRLSYLGICNMPYIFVFLLILKITLCSDFIKETHTEKKHQAIKLNPKLVLLPISRLNGQTPFTAFERAILPASFVPNCFIWKHPEHITEVLACLNVILTVKGLSPFLDLLLQPAYFGTSSGKMSTTSSLNCVVTCRKHTIRQC